MDDVRLAGLQLRRAWTLASAYGHEWAGALIRHERAIGMVSHYDSEPSPTPLGEYTSEDIAAITERERDEHGLAGITAPTTLNDPDDSDAPVVEHTTGSWRLRWRVYAGGEVELSVWRPDPHGQVLRAYVSPQNDVETYITNAGHFAQRHVTALQTALVALVGQDAIAPCQDLRKRAQDGHLSQAASELVDEMAEAIREMRNEGRLVQRQSPDEADLRIALSFVTGARRYRSNGSIRHTGWEAARIRAAIDRELAAVEEEWRRSSGGGAGAVAAEQWRRSRSSGSRR